MASLRTRTRADGTVSFTVLYRDGPRQSSATFDQASGAKAFMRDVDRHGIDTALRILDARRELDVDHRTVAQQVRAHIDALPAITLGTRRRYEMIARTLEAHRLGNLPLDVVHHNDVAAWVRDLADSGLSGKTISTRQQLLSAAFKRAVKDELMTRNAAHGVKLPRSERLEQTFLTGAEFEALLDHIPARYQDLAVTLVSTGLRIGEAAALQVRDVHLGHTPPDLTVSRTWTITQGPEKVTGPPKTERGRRTIALPPQAVAVLAPHVTGRPAKAWVFTEDGTQPLKLGRLGEAWRKAVRVADIGKEPRLHDLRHTHASWMLAAHVPLTELQHRLGHNSIKVTSDTYGHLLPEAQIRAAYAAAQGFAVPQIGPRPDGLR